MIRHLTESGIAVVRKKASMEAEQDTTTYKITVFIGKVILICLLPL